MFKLKRKIAKNRLPQVIGAMRAAVAKVVNDTADEVETIAKELAPVKTGNLRDSIHTENYADEAMAKAVVVDADYAAAVEFGTHNMEAQPFLRPALESVASRRDEKLKEIAAEFEKEIR